jgi:toluene monooxygenase system protein D
VSVSDADRLGVGPVLHATPFARMVVEEIQHQNDGAVVRDEGAYLRVLSPRVCRLSRAGVEDATGSAVRFPGDLEVVMSSFAGLMRLDEQGAVWWLAGEPAPISLPRDTEDAS